MKTPDLIDLMDREAGALRGRGDTVAAMALEEGACRLRTLAARLERMGESAEATPVVSLFEPDPDGIAAQ